MGGPVCSPTSAIVASWVRIELLHCSLIENQEVWEEIMQRVPETLRTNTADHLTFLPVTIALEPDG